MPYLNCPKCGLSVHIRNAELWISNCPRCLARQRRASPMTLEDEPLRMISRRLPVPVRAVSAQGGHPRPRAVEL